MSPADLLDEVKRFARRRPVAFLALAAAAGVVAGRVTRGAVAANTSVDSDNEPTPARAYDSDVYDRGGYDGAGYGGPRVSRWRLHARYGESVRPGSPGRRHNCSEQSGATGTAYPNVTPVGDEAVLSAAGRGRGTPMTDYAGQAPPRRQYQDMPERRRR